MKFLSGLFFSILLFLGVCVGRVHTGSSKSSPDAGYLFPTDASHKINSGFADYRSSHFHGGMDISTNGRIGYPVFAAKSGYVYRISVSPFGYGKMLILRHDDSTFTLYAHLSAFSEEIERKVESAQDEENKYGVNLKLNAGEIVVDRGEVIAYTGATGVGGPHLHFEIRDKDFSFVDPLLFNTLDVPDYRNPRIFNVAVRGFVSGEAKVSSVVSQRVPHGIPDHSYKAKQTFHMAEPFYFVIHGADSYGGKFKRPPKYILLRIDGKDFINLNLTHFNADEYMDVASVVDLGLSRRLKTYYDLCVNRAFPFSVFTPGVPLSGLVGENFPNGNHSYEISIEDEDGHRASVSGKFVLDIPRPSDKSLDSNSDLSITPYKEKIFNLSPSLTIRFPANSFARNIDVEARLLSPTSFEIESENEMLRSKAELTWKVKDPALRLYRKLKRRWSYVDCYNDGSFLRAKIGYRTGVFALLRDKTPPVVGKVRFSKRNPFYRSVAPKDIKRVFVYFKVSDRLSGVNTDDILLNVGKQKYLCEYDVDKHAAVCQVDLDQLRSEKKVSVIVSDNAGNERRVVSRTRL